MTTPTPPAGRTPGLGFIFVTMLLDVMGFGLIIPVMPQLVAQFMGGSLSDASLVLGALIATYTLMQFLCAPLLGALSDRYGRKPVLLFSLAGAAIGYGLMASATSLVVLFISRFIAGIAGASLTVASAYIADVSSPEKRAQNFGLSGAAFGLGFIAGPALGGLLGNWNTALPFWVAAGVTLVNLLYGAFLVPESHKLENRRAFSWTSANPVSWIGLLAKYPLVLGLAGCLVWVGLAQQCLHNTWVLFTSFRFQWTPFENGLSLALVGVMAAIVQGGLIRVILPRLGERRAILFGLGLNAIGFVAFGLATHGWMMYAILVATSLAGISGPAMQGLVSRHVSASEQGGVQGALTSLMSATGIVGPLIANGLFGYFTGPKAPVPLPGVAFFLGALLCLVALGMTMRLFARQGAPEAAPAEPVAAA